MDDRTEREILARLYYIERYLVQLGAQSGYRYTPFSVSMAVAQQVAELARQGMIDEAIKRFREVTHANPQQAEDVIAELASGDRLVFGSGAGSFDAYPGSFGPEDSYWADDMPGMAQPYLSAAGGGGVGADIVALARSGRMIEAIKMYRQRTGLSLKEAKRAVEMAARGFVEPD